MANRQHVDTPPPPRSMFHPTRELKCIDRQMYRFCSPEGSQPGVLFTLMMSSLQSMVTIFFLSSVFYSLAITALQNNAYARSHT